MNDTPYEPTPEDANELRLYRHETIQCLIRYGGLSETEARERVDAGNLFKLNNETTLTIIFHEEPYFWAMMMLYARNDPLWYKDPELWPPPAEYFEWRETIGDPEDDSEI